MSSFSPLPHFRRPIQKSQRSGECLVSITCLRKISYSEWQYEIWISFFCPREAKIMSYKNKFDCIARWDRLDVQCDLNSCWIEVLFDWCLRAQGGSATNWVGIKWEWGQVFGAHSANFPSSPRYLIWKKNLTSHVGEEERRLRYWVSNLGFYEVYWYWFSFEIKTLQDESSRHFQPQSILR